MRRPPDGVREVTKVLEAQTPAVRVAVEDLKGGDFVLVVLDELPEVLDGLSRSVRGVTSMQDLVHARFVDDLLVGAAEVDDLEPQLRVRRQWVDGGFDQVGCCLLHVLGGWLTGFGANLRDCVLVVGIEGGDQRLGYLPDARPVGELLKHHSVSLA